MYYPNNIEEKIDFTVIRGELLRRCASALGREHVEAMRMETDYATVTRLLSLTDQMRLVQADPMQTFPRGDIHDVREAISRIRIEGLFLDEAELDALRHSLRYAAELEAFLGGLDETKYPLLRELPNNQNNQSIPSNLSLIVKEIDRILDRYGKLADNASPELGRIRREMMNLQGSVGRTLSSILRQAKADGFVESDATPTLQVRRFISNRNKW